MSANHDTIEQINKLIGDGAAEGQPPAEPTAGDGQPAAPAAEPAEPASDPLSQIDTDGMGVTPAAEPAAGEGEPAAPEPGAPPATFEEMAERLGMDVADLYQVAVPLGGDAEPITLGQMKDHAQSAETLQARELGLEELRTEFENHMLRQRQELESIVKLLPQVPRELIARAQEVQAETLERERAALLSIKPEWRDDGVYQQAKADMLEMASDYGFTRTDLEAVVDHRLTKLLHDFTELRQRVAAAKASAKTASEAQPRQGQQVGRQQQRQGARQAAAQKAKETGKLGDQVNAVHALISGDS